MTQAATTGSVKSDPISAPVSVKIFRSVEELERLRWFWSSCAGLRNSDIDMMLTAQRSSGDVLRPHVLGLYRDDRPDALLIGRIVRRRLPFQVGYFKVLAPLVTIMTFPYGALRGHSSSGNCELLIREVMKSVRNGESDLALLEHVDVDSDLFRCGWHEAGFLLRDRFSPVRPHFKRELANNLQDLQASLSPSQRTRFRRIEKRLFTDFPGNISVVTLGSPNELGRIIRDVEEVAQKTWQRKLGLGGFNTSAALRDLLRTEAEMGWLRVYVLYVAGKPSAFWAGAVYQNTFYSDFLGYDPDYARYSLGTYLLSFMLKDLCLQGLRAFDFGFTEDEYKRHFGNVMWHETSLHLFPPTFRGVGLSVLRGITAVITNLGRTVLKHTGLIERVKKVWRRAAIGG